MATITNKDLCFGTEARQKMYLGATKLYTAVSSTLGPKGRLAVIENFNRTTPNVTKDGVTVAESIALEDRFEDMGVQLIKSVSSRAGIEVGDGTTTSTVLAYHIIHNALEAMEDHNANPVQLQRGINWGAEIALEALSEHITPISTHEQLKYIATISANNDTVLGGNVADAFESAGEHGIIVISDDRALGKDEIKVPKGTFIKRGYESPYFVKSGQSVVNMKDAIVVIIDNELTENTTTAEELNAFIGNLTTTNKPIWVVAWEFSSEVTSMAIAANRQYGPGVLLTRAPGFGDRRRFYVEDLATLTGATPIAKLEELTSNHLGDTYTLRADGERTTFTFDSNVAKDELIKQRIASLKQELVEADPTSFIHNTLSERIAILGGKVVEVVVGGYSDGAHLERKARYDDAIRAVGAARQYGVIVGGGKPHLLAKWALDTEISLLAPNDPRRLGAEILAVALTAPIITLMSNAGYDENRRKVIIDRLGKGKDRPNLGLNLNTDELVDLSEAGVIDPAKVAIASISIAAELAGLFITTETLIVEANPDKNTW